MCADECGCPRGLEEGTGSSGASATVTPVIEGYDLPDMGVGNFDLSSTGVGSMSNC